MYESWSGSVFFIIRCNLKQYKNKISLRILEIKMRKQCHNIVLANAASYSANYFVQDRLFHTPFSVALGAIASSEIHHQQSIIWLSPVPALLQLLITLSLPLTSFFCLWTIVSQCLISRSWWIPLYRGLLSKLPVRISCADPFVKIVKTSSKLRGSVMHGQSVEGWYFAGPYAVARS